MSSRRLRVKPTHTLCTTTVEIARACLLLRAAPYVLVDCEGGDSSGPSIVQLGTPHAEQVFLFDLYTLRNPRDQASHAHLASVLADTRIVKVFWDGRGDYWELCAACGVRTAPAVDLQLVDIYSRAVRGQKHEARLGRLSHRSSPFRLLSRLQLEEVHGLNSMDSAILEHRVEAPLKDGEQLRVALIKLRLTTITRSRRETYARRGTRGQMVPATPPCVSHQLRRCRHCARRSALRSLRGERVPRRCGSPGVEILLQYLLSYLSTAHSRGEGCWQRVQTLGHSSYECLSTRIQHTCAA